MGDAGERPGMSLLADAIARPTRPVVHMSTSISDYRVGAADSIRRYVSARTPARSSPAIKASRSGGTGHPRQLP
jgi:hypothetical protein